MDRGVRRYWMIVGIVAAFGVGALLGSVWLDDEPQSVEVPAIVNQWGDAFVAGSPEALAALYAEGGAFNCRAFDFTITDEEIADVVLGDETDFTEFKPTTVLVGDEIIAVEYLVRAESPSGRKVSTPLIAIFDVDDSGLINRSTIDYDREEMFPDQFSGASEEGFTALGCRATG